MTTAKCYVKRAIELKATYKTYIFESDQNIANIAKLNITQHQTIFSFNIRNCKMAYYQYEIIIKQI